MKIINSELFEEYKKVSGINKKCKINKNDIKKDNIKKLIIVSKKYLW